MTTAVAISPVCEVCGEPLDEKEICVACLLRVGLDGAATSSPSPFGDFEINQRNDGSLCELGRGAMGVTYRATDHVLHRPVALKVIEASNVQPLRERFLREARAAAALRHPNIAGVFQFGVSRDGERCYCAMELVEGETLDARVRRDGPLPAGQTLEIAMQVGQALIAAADCGLVHRDLKPGNIMLSANEQGLQVKVIDFGLAKAVNAAGEMELTQNGFVGTPAFASPEQFSRGDIDARTDIYALGVTMWFALTGRLPFAGTSIKEIRERQAAKSLPNDQLKSRAVPKCLIELLQSCLAINPAERPASARELMRDFEACRAKISQRRRGLKIAVAALACTTIAATVASVSLLSRQRNPIPVSPLENMFAVKPTENGQAYLLFLRGRQVETDDQFEQALDFYAKAFALDPSFALARARFSICATELAHIHNDPRRAAEARTAADEALRLSPNLADAHLALANCYLEVGRDYDRALQEIIHAGELAPNSAEVQLMAALVYKGQNKLRRRIEALRRAEEINPDNIRVWSKLVLTYEWVRDWPHAIEALDRRAIVAARRGPPFRVSRWSRACVEFQLTGDIDALKKATAEEGAAETASAAWLAFQRFETAMFERDYTSAARYLAQIPADTSALTDVVAAHPKAFHEALLAVANGSASRLREEALQIAERAFPEPMTASDTQALADVALIHALLGRKEEAIREAMKAVDATEGPGTIEKNAMSAVLALVYAQTGETEKALALIEHLLTVPCETQGGAIFNMTLNDLRWRWVWDPLRSNPRFQKLLAGPEPKTIY